MKRRIETNTSQEALQQFLSEKRANGLTEKTIKGYEKDISALLNDVDTISELTQTYMSSLINEMLLTKKPVTVNHYLRGYRAFLYWCMENNYLEPYKIKLVRCQEAPIKAYSKEDIEKLVEKPTHKDNFGTWRSWCCVVFALGTGARAGTIVNIKVEDIDLNRKEVVYRHTKNKKSSIIPLCDSLVKALRYYMNEFELNEYLFSTSEYKLLDTGVLNHSVRRFCINRGVEFKSFHAFRHTFAREFILNGGNCFQLQKILDHSSLAMSQHYAQIFGQELSNEINAFSPLSKIKTDEHNRIARKK